MRSGYPLHRSLVLWSGLLVMAFTGWAWMDSRSHDSYVKWRRISAGNAQNGIAVVSSSLSGTSWVEWRRERARRVFPDDLASPPFFLRGTARESGLPMAAEPEEPATLKEYIGSVMARRPPQAWCLFIPHWLLLLGVAGVTGGLLGWRVSRWRKWQRMQEHAAESTMEGVA